MKSTYTDHKPILIFLDSAKSNSASFLVHFNIMIMITKNHYDYKLKTDLLCKQSLQIPYLGSK